MKRALVLSGGGSKGAYQAGAIEYLIKQKQLHFDIICGSSVGSINASYLSQYNTFQEKEAIEDLLELWKNIKQKDIYENWFPFGWFQFWKKGLYNTKPLKKYLNKILDIDKIKKSNKQLSIGSVSLTNGKYITVNKNNPDLIDYIVGSCSIPILFPPNKINNDFFIDAGIRENIPLEEAIKLGADEIYIISTNTDYLDIINIKNTNISQLIFRFVEILLFESIKNDLSKIEKINNEIKLGIKQDKKIIKCFLIHPNKQLTKKYSNFVHKEIMKMIDIGFQDAEYWLNKYGRK